MSDKKIDAQQILEKLKEFDINDVDWENMGSWPIIGKAIFCSILAIGVIVGGYFLMVDPKLIKLDRAEQQEVKLKKDYEQRAFQVANLEEYKAQMKEMEESFESILKQLPRDTEVPGLIDDISLAALNNGLDLQVIEPKEQVASEFYYELPIAVEATGDYHELGAFVSSVAALPRIVTLHDFSISSNPDNTGLLKLKILAKTYRYNEGE